MLQMHNLLSDALRARLPQLFPDLGSSVASSIVYIRRIYVAQDTMTQYAISDPIKKLRMYRVRGGIHVGQAILKEIVYVVDDSGNPLMKTDPILLAGDDL
ncbi:DNA polymerase II large subunit [Striga asiatica]|uniref:DNA polymerase II large subunit n=1 Tax=Striga asiatica TaxID=4170 RepID=A0A5A7QP25_STRAF|nr:DNA polymerase II large subunit [Striga asiatica]